MHMKDLGYRVSEALMPFLSNTLKKEIVAFYVLPFKNIFTFHGIQLSFRTVLPLLDFEHEQTVEEQLTLRPSSSLRIIYGTTILIDLSPNAAKNSKMLSILSCAIKKKEVSRNTKISMIYVV